MLVGKKIAIEVNFLTGRYVATAHHDREQSEWPPHPARLFSTLVAEWAGVEEPDQLEREALKWLEAQAPPEISASAATARKVVAHFVPVNDARLVERNLYARKFAAINAVFEGKETEKIVKILNNERNVEILTKPTRPNKSAIVAAQNMLPERHWKKGKQQRFFPSMAPDEPRVVYTWNAYPRSNLCKVLDQLLCRITRLGHSSSLVSCRVVFDPPSANLVPSSSGIESLRNVQVGQLEELKKHYDRHQGVRSRSLPYTSVRYGPALASLRPEPKQANTAGDWIVFEFDQRSRFFPMTETVSLAAAMRSAIFCYTDNPIPEGISGHDPFGAPTTTPHVAFLPLPYIGFEHADGRLLGFAVSIPKTLDHFSRQALLTAIGNWEKSTDKPNNLIVTLGPQGVLRMSRLRVNSTMASLMPSVWRGPSCQWVSATPIALPRHPGQMKHGSQNARAKAWSKAHAMIEAACTHVDLPKPSRVELAFSPFITGSYPATPFPPFQQNNRNGKRIKRQLIHALVEFNFPVAGPLVLGAGRFLGLGLMRPVQVKKGESSYMDKTDG